MTSAAPTIVAIGEALWDVFPDRRLPGGAPCNVAFHAAQLGCRGVIVTRVGSDPAGSELAAFLYARGVVTDYIQRDAHRPTGTVVVTVSGDELRYAITEDVAWDALEAEPAAREIVHAADAVVVGSLAQRSPFARTATRALLTAVRANATVICDVNLRAPFVDARIIEAACRSAAVVKMNGTEEGALSALLARPALIPWLLDEIGVRAVCVTRGPQGATLHTRDGAVSVPGAEIHAPAVHAVGAGDAFTAAMARELVRGATPEEVLTTANRYAALVASRPGGMPRLTPAELAAAGVTPSAPPPRGAQA